jgi:chromate transport protein ChrA
MNKYYEGSIYLNFYLEGCAGIIACIVASLIYSCFKMLWSFVFSFSITILGCIFLLLFQQGYISAKDFGAEGSPYPEGSE